MIEKLVRNYSAWGFRIHVEKDVERYERDALDGRLMTRNELLDFLFGAYEQNPKTHLDLYLRKPQHLTFWHRLNRMWLYPLTFILAPLRYLFFGQVYWDEKGKIGYRVLKMCGYVE